MAEIWSNQAAPVAQREFVLGGQKSGKSRRAEALAHAWLQAGAGRDAVLIATAEAWDDEMRDRIARHREDRALRVPGLRTVEEPVALASAIRAQSAIGCLVVVDCLTLWLTQLRMPHPDAARGPISAAGEQTALDELLAAIAGVPGPLVLVGNEIGLGLSPLGAEVRGFVDALGRLNQQVAQACERVTLMVAGCPMAVKGPAA